MAELSLFECSKASLQKVPVVEGQLVVCTDTGNFYRDTNNSRIELGTSVTTVSALPLSPIENKLYLMNGTQLYLQNGTDWLWVNHVPQVVITANSISEFPKVGNSLCIYLDKSSNSSYRQDDTDVKYYCIGNDYRNITIICGGGSLTAN